MALIATLPPPVPMRPAALDRIAGVSRPLQWLFTALLAVGAVILLGAILVAGEADGGIALTVALIAVVLAAVNMVGGFLVTDRMLQMFTRKKPAPAKPAAGEGR